MMVILMQYRNTNRSNDTVTGNDVDTGDDADADTDDDADADTDDDLFFRRKTLVH